MVAGRGFAAAVPVALALGPNTTLTVGQPLASDEIVGEIVGTKGVVGQAIYSFSSRTRSVVPAVVVPRIEATVLALL